MRYLIFGLNGMVGHTVALYLSEKGYDVTGFSHNSLSYCKSIIGDVRNTDLIKQIISNKYDIIVNCVGILNQYAEKDIESAIYINSYFPHLLAKNTNSKIIQISTDCIYDDTIYGKTKALGELNYNKNLTIRTSVIGADMNPNGIGLLNWFMMQNGIIKGYINSIWAGITSLELAKVVENLNYETGIHNIICESRINKYDLLCLFNKYLRKNKLIIEPFKNRFENKSLIKTSFNYEIPNYEQMIKELALWIKTYKELYPHYKVII